MCCGESRVLILAGVVIPALHIIFPAQPGPLVAPRPFELQASKSRAQASPRSEKARMLFRAKYNLWFLFVIRKSNLLLYSKVWAKHCVARASSTMQRVEGGIACVVSEVFALQVSMEHTQPLPSTVLQYVLIDPPPASNQNDKRSMVRGCLEWCPVSTILTVFMESTLRVQKRKPGKSCRVLCDT